MPDHYKASWRGKGKEKSASARHRWQEAAVQDVGYESKKLWYRTKIAILAGLALTLFGVFGWALFFLEPWPGLLAITVTRYDWPVAPNAQAKEDYQQLVGLDQQTLRAKGLYDSWNTGDKDALTRERALKQLNEQLEQYWRTKRSWFRQNREVVIFYMSMHGAVNGQGAPCLLLPRAPALDGSAWLPLSEVLKTINDQLPKPVRKLLVLDCTRMLSNWNLGLLYNGFAESLQGVVDDVNVPNLVVLNASSPGQVSWTSPQSSFGSVFGHYLRLGLGGAADGMSNKAKDGVTLEELTAYLQKEVGQWVAENRADAQTPQLIKPSKQQIKDFQLARAAPGRIHRILSGKKGAEAADTEGEEDRISASSTQEIGTLWLRHQELQARAALRANPLKWQTFEQKLLWLEQLSLAGTAYQADYQNALKELRRLADELDQQGVGPIPPLSLPLAKYREKLPEYLQVVEDEWKKFQADPTLQTLQLGLKRIDDFGLIPAGLKPGPVELHFMRMLSRHLDAGWKIPASGAARLAGRAARVRDMAEEAAAPGDERVHYWVRRSVDDADRARRDAEDQLFVGGDSKAGTEAERILAAATSDARKVSQALAVRDRAFAELPYWAEWFTRPARPDAAEKNRDPRTPSDLLALIRRARALSDQLNRPDSDRADATTLADAAADLRRELDELASEFQRHCTSLLDPNRKDAANLRDIADTLDSPLATGELRNRLRATYADRLRNASRGESVGRLDQAKAERGQLDRLSDWEEHPAVLLVQSKAQAVSSSSNLDALTKKGELIREWLSKTILEEARRGLHRETQDRALTSESDALTRRVAVLKADWRDLGEEPAQLLRTYDLHALLAWQCRRTLDDFWGPGANDPRPYFVLASEQYLASAQALLQKKLGELEDLKSRRISAARNLGTKRTETPQEADGFTIQAKSLAVIDDEEEEEYGHSVAISHHADLPTGTASYFVHSRGADTGGETIPVSSNRGGVAVPRQAVPVSDDAKSSAPLSLSYFLPRRELQKHGESLQAEVLYRGHVFLKDIRYLPDRGNVVNYIRPVYEDPKLIVRGPDDRGAVMFIFDCSYSMVDMTNVPGVAGAAPTRRPRIELAKNAFNDTLKKLAERSQAGQGSAYNVGVIFYGHRMSRDGRPSVKYEDRIRKFGQPINRGLKAGEDTELLLPISPLKNLEDAGIKNLLGHLNAVEPWGITPLYPAVIKAAEELRKVDTPNRRIIAITDGMDNQGEGTARKLPEHIIEACRGIPIYFVGFDMPKTEEEQARKDFENIVKKCGGAFLNANNPANLLRNLEQSLDLRRYVVRSSENVIVTAEQDLDKGRTILRRAQAEEYVAEVLAVNPDDNLRTPPMRLEGGESIKLRFGTGKLLFEGYDDEGIERIGLRERQNPGERFDLRILRPEVGNNAASFSMCLENSDPAKFSPRPVEIWANVKPITNDPAAQKGTYAFYDRAFEPDTPVPLMRFKAEEWPDGVQSARIELWCKMRSKTAVDKAKVLPIGQFASGLPQTVQFPNMSPVNIEVEARQAGKDGMLRVDVTEIHAETAPSWNPLKVEIDATPQPNCKRAVHRFSESHKMAKHTFYFENAGDKDVSQFRLLLTPHSAVKEDAMYSGEIIVKVR